MSLADEVKEELKRDAPIVARHAGEVLDEIVALHRAHGGASHRMPSDVFHRVVDLLVELVGGPASKKIEKPKPVEAPKADAPKVA